VLGGLWLAAGESSQTPLEAGSVIPPFTGLASIVLIVSNFLAYAGMEVNAVHANDMKNPGKNYPKAILIASVLIVGVFILPTLAIALAVPGSQLGLTTGINVAFQVYFDRFGMGWATAVLSGMIAFGALASVVTWIAGPSRGLLLAANRGLLPSYLQRRNSAGVQVGILTVQGIIVTLLAAIFVVVPNVGSAFFTLVDMAAALYLIMYMLMFAAAIRLRSKAPSVVRSYRVPAMPVIAGVGFLASLSAFLLGFVPPSGLSGIPTAAYPLVIIVLGGPALLFYQFRKPGWDTRSAEEKSSGDADLLVNPPSLSQGA
jgi:glutamate:GABA antiporter